MAAIARRLRRSTITREVDGSQLTIHSLGVLNALGVVERTLNVVHHVHFARCNHDDKFRTRVGGTTQYGI